MVVLLVALLQWALYGLLSDKLSYKVSAIGGIVVAHSSLCWWLFTKGSESFQ